MEDENVLMEEINLLVERDNQDMNERSRKIKEMDALLATAVIQDFSFALTPDISLYWSNETKKLMARTYGVDKPLIEHKAIVRKSVTNDWGKLLLKIKEML